MGKKRRSNKKKSDLEEIYPDYLMQAFFGEKLLASASYDTSGTGGALGKKRRRKPSSSGQDAAGSSNPSRTISTAEQYQLGESSSDFKRMVSCF